MNYIMIGLVCIWLAILIITAIIKIIFIIRNKEIYNTFCVVNEIKENDSSNDSN